MAAPFQHPTSVVEDGAHVGDDTKVWHFAHVRSEAKIGSECILGKNVFVDAGVTIGNRCKIQNNVSVYHGVTIEDGVFVGPHVCFTNDKLPRAITPDGSLRSATDWTLVKTTIKHGTAIGANATIVAGITLGEWTMVGSGSVVTKSTPPYSLMLGNPAKPCGIVGPSGNVLSRKYEAGVYKDTDGREIEILPEWV